MALKSLVSVVVLAVSMGVAGCSSPSEEASPQSMAPTSASQSASASPEGSASAETSEAAPEAEPVAIKIRDFKFSGAESVAPGATITVQNDDQSTHSVTSENDGFVEVIVEGGATGTFKAPSEPGEYAYVCKFHPEMVGTLVVK